MNLNARKIRLFSTLMCLLFSSALPAKDLVTVDGNTISMESVAAALRALGPQGKMVVANPDLKKKFVDHMVNSSLVAKKARSEGFDKTPEFQARLTDMTTQLLAGEYMDALAAKNTSEKQLKKWFSQNKEGFSKKEVHAFHILCDDEKTAEKALAESLQSPQNFENIAKKYSKDKTIDLGFFGRGRMVPEFEKVAFNTKIGTINKKPVKTQFGWHVIKVLETRGNDNVEFSLVKDDVAKKYRQHLQEELIHNLRKKSKIAINEQSLKDLKLP